MDNIWKFGGYSRRYYITHPWKWVSDFLRRVRWAWQRSKRGYADCDWWNMDYWMIAVLPSMFDDFAKYHCGYPAGESGFTDEQWTAYIKEIAQHLRNCDEEQKTNVNEYEEEFEAMMDARSTLKVIRKDERDNIVHELPEETPEEKELSRKYFDRHEEIYTWRCNEAIKAFEMIGKQFFSLWD